MPDGFSPDAVFAIVGAGLAPLASSLSTGGATGVAFGLDKAGGCPFPSIAVHDLPREPTKNPASPPNTTLTPSTVAAITQTSRRCEGWWAFSGDLAQLGTEACWVAARLAGRPRFDADGSGSGGGGTDNGGSGKAANSDMGRGLSASSKYAD
ncbi:MAG TPA: hypothetical protein VF518_12395, partial [Polyangia bacterium]